MNEWQDLAQLADLVVPQARNRTDFLQECKDGNLTGTSIIFRTFHSVQLTGRFDEELINVLPTTLNFICHNGTLLCHKKKSIQDKNFPTEHLSCFLASLDELQCPNSVLS